MLLRLKVLAPCPAFSDITLVEVYHGGLDSLLGLCSKHGVTVLSVLFVWTRAIII